MYVNQQLIHKIWLMYKLILFEVNINKNKYIYFFLLQFIVKNK